MKKRILLSFISALIAGNILGQKAADFGDNISTAPNHPFYKKVNKSADPYSGWYNAYSRVDAIGSGADHYHRLFSDTIVKEIFNEGPLGSRFISKGQVMDPTSPMWKFMDVQVSEREPYKLDSLAIRILYDRRIQSSPPDTLLVQLYSSSQMEYFEEYQGEPFNYCKPTYDSQTRKGSNASKEYKIVLVPALEFDGNPKIAMLDVDFDIPAGEEVAVSLHFIPAHPYKAGDTLRDWTNNGIGNVNYVGVFLFQDYGKVYYEGHYNYALEVFAQPNVFNQKVSDFVMDFAPAILRNSGWHTDISFKFTFNDVVGINDDLEQFQYTIYPNPASNEMNVSGLKSESEVRIYNQLGQLMMSNVISPENSSIDVSQLSKGLYVLNIEGITQRIIVK